MPFMTLAEWIEKEGITRSEAARRLQISPSYMTELCQRKRNPSVLLAISIVELSKGKIKVRELIGEVAEVPRGT